MRIINYGIDKASQKEISERKPVKAETVPSKPKATKKAKVSVPADKAGGLDEAFSAD